ncbi:neither inactivation nor afterpotential protein G isoform X1 [Bactrocera dorsalis]|uniref:Neither inactivation nor afterpotential protein G n=1 Tax=Bactrocera dorsalis TaxID=27457 RepID=A0A034VLK0_BACDO|nr:neither inactivation nor afterpotential protein G isoform X1 [Bactrocera dorsalis]
MHFQRMYRKLLREKHIHIKILFLGAIAIAFLAFLWFAFVSLFGDNTPNELNPQAGYAFDYIVVGAGTAGSVVASLLAKHSPTSTVLLIEAGDSFGLLSKIPLLTTFQQKGLNDWGFVSEPQVYSSRGLGEQRQYLPRGKGLGGSAMLNYMLHFDGEPRDFERWSSRHNLTDWRWKDIRPFLTAVRTQTHSLFEIPADYSKITEALYNLKKESPKKNWRFRRARYTIKNGLRHNVFHQFLLPSLNRRNLFTLTNAYLKRLNLVYIDEEKSEVQTILVGVMDTKNHEEYVFSVDVQCEVILCAGAYQSPQILLASGIGDASLFEALDMRQQLQLPLVGENLHDHLNLPLFVSIDTVGPTLNQRALLNPLQILNYLVNGYGHLGNFGVLGHIDSSYEDSFGLTFFGVGAVDESALMSISNFKQEYFRALFPRYHNTSQEGFVLISTCLQPKSRGTVSISMPNTRWKPIIDPNYLREAGDIDCTIRAIRAAVEVVKSASFAPLNPRIHWPKFDECKKYGPTERDFVENMPTDRYLECVMRYVGLGSHHPGGTCVMGTSANNSVVDSKFKVHGVENLRVIDASVLPTPISGNPNSIIIGMAIRGATIILQKEKIKKK